MLRSTRVYLYLITGYIILVFCSGYAFSQDTASESPQTATGAVVSEAPAATANLENPAKAEVPSAVTETQPAVEEVKPAIEAQPVAEVKPAIEEIKWVWAEVTSVDEANNKLVVKYLDYDTDEEKELIIVVDSSTRFENAEGIKAIAVGDSVGVDYMLNANGEAVAKSIALEKVESTPQATPPETLETPPQETKIAPEEIKIAPEETIIIPEEAKSVPETGVVETPAEK